MSHTYVYKGPVMLFDKVVADNWSASTNAVSDGKARSNLAYKFKKQFNMVPSMRIILPGELKRLD